MIRYTLFILAIAGTAATAIASVKQNDQFAITDPTAVTVVYKTSNEFAPHKIILEKCAVEDCSDTQS
jgi:hypothetical protein